MEFLKMPPTTFVYASRMAGSRWARSQPTPLVVRRVLQRCQSTHQAAGTLPRGASHTPAATTDSSTSTQSTVLPPHSLMPTAMLLRASLVSTITSKPWLLNLALSTLTFLTQTRVPLFQVEKNPIIHAVLKQTLYNHFCAGENGGEVTRTIQRLKEIGFKGVILTYAREIVVDASLEEKGKGTLDAESGTGDTEAVHSPDIEIWRDGVLETVRLLSSDDFLALKLTGAGASVMTSLSSTRTVPTQMTQALDEVCSEALRRKVRILVDAEQQSVQPGIDAVALDLMRKYNRDGSGIVHNTYQAYLKSTPHTLRAHMNTAQAEGFTLGVKLVRGAYMASEPRHLINDTKADTDASYDGIAEGLLQQTYRPFSRHTDEAAPRENWQSETFPNVALFLATHNKDSATTAHRLHSSRLATGEPTVPTVQYGQLLGMADEVSCSLLQAGQQTTADAAHADTRPKSAHVVPEVYKCLSWGPLEVCLSYLLRRARENKDALGRSKAEYRAVWAEIRRRMRASLPL